MSLSKPSEGEIKQDKSDSEDIETEKESIDWMKNQLEKEVKRLKDSGQNALPLFVSKMGIMREPKKIVNRLEVQTGFDFNTVKDVLISEATPNPYRKGFYYVNIVLFTDKPLPILLPYMYKMETRNHLQDWLFINSKGERSRHHIESFQPIIKS